MKDDAFAYSLITSIFAVIVALIRAAARKNRRGSPNHRDVWTPKRAPAGSTFGPTPTRVASTTLQQSGLTEALPWDGITREEQWQRDHPEEVNILSGLSYPLNIHYRDRFGNETRRRIIVDNLVGRPDAKGDIQPTTLRAYCERVRGMRSFLVVSIIEAIDGETREVLTDVAGRLMQVAAWPVGRPTRLEGERVEDRRAWLFAKSLEGLSDDQIYWRTVAHRPEMFPNEFLEPTHGPPVFRRRPLTKSQGFDPKRLQAALEGIELPMKIEYEDMDGSRSDRRIKVRRLLARPMPDGVMLVTTLWAYCQQQKTTRTFSLNRLIAAYDAEGQTRVADVPWYVWRMTAAHAHAEKVPQKAPRDPSRIDIPEVRARTKAGDWSGAGGIK